MVKRLAGSTAGTWLSLVMLAAALLLAGSALGQLVPVPRWGSALLWPDPARMAEVVAADSLLPRLAAALLAGAALGLSGGLLQQVLRNPLASPGTIGISAGAQLALAVVSLYAPALLGLVGRDVVAAAGGAAAVAVVLALSWRSRLAPGTVLLCGLVVGLYAGSLGGVLVLLHTRQLAGLFIWASGSLVQLGWDVPRQLLLRLVLAGALAALLARPLRLLQLPDDMARGIGVAVPVIRLTGLAVAVGLGSSVVGLVGVIGFVGLAAPALVRLTGGSLGSGSASPLRCALLGAGLLAVTDQLVQLGTGLGPELLPTGAVTALLGAPLLLILLGRLQPGGPSETASAPAQRRTRALPVLIALCALLAAMATAAVLLGPAADGWHLNAAVWPLRLPRMAGAAMAGAMLAVAGLLMQRLLQNPVASPDVLGISTGTMLGLVAALWFGVQAPAGRLLCGAVGGTVALLAILGFAGRGTSPSRMVLAGLALAAMFEGLLALLLASGDPRADTVLAWMSGSTYLVDPPMAGSAALGLVVLFGLVALTMRWLDLLPLGSEMALALGLRPGLARLLLLALSAALTGMATLLVGPLSFVGLVAPHAARLLGLHRASTQMAGAALFGAALMVTADWMGRTALFPSEIPAGVIAALLGGPVLLWALTRPAR